MATKSTKTGRSRAEDGRKVRTLSQKSPDVPEGQLDLKILQSIRRIMRAVDIHSRKLRARCELTGPQLVCLSTVAERGPLTVSAIAGLVYLSPSTVVGILDRLEARGLVRRERDTRDRRVVNIEVTSTGERVVKRAPSALQDGLHSALKNLPRLEQATIAFSLQRVVDLMEAGDIDASPILEAGNLVPPVISKSGSV